MSIGCTCRPVFGPQGPSLPNAVWRTAGFHGDRGQSLLIQEDDSPVLLIGLGSNETVDHESLRAAAALAARTLAHADSASWDFDAMTPSHLPAHRAAQSIAEGVTLGSYRPTGSLGTQWSVPTAHREAWATGVAIGRATARARDLVNSPPNVLTPSAFATYCERLGVEHGLTVTIRAQEELTSLGFGGIVAVGQGSSEPAFLIEVVHGRTGQRPDLSLVGKG